ncbi:hypothetical protein CIW48_26965 [Methylobacterium sp. P1-11]|nr:hypothetical protein CIW48_26965 [Methylobacterium sp. P1-11]
MTPPPADHIILALGIIAPCLTLVGVWATVDTARLLAEYRRDCPQLTGGKFGCTATEGRVYDSSDLYAIKCEISERGEVL